MKIRLAGKEISVQLSPFKNYGNQDYFLLDTGCILYLLPRARSLVHRIRKKGLKLAILEYTIREVEDHLNTSLEEKEEKSLDTSGPRTGMESFEMMLGIEEIKKIANPEKAREDEEFTREFGSDGSLIRAFREGAFKGLAVDEHTLLRKIKGKSFRGEELLKS